MAPRSDVIWNTAITMPRPPGPTTSPATAAGAEPMKAAASPEIPMASKKGRRPPAPKPPSRPASVRCRRAAPGGARAGRPTDRPAAAITPGWLRRPGNRSGEGGVAAQPFDHEQRHQRTPQSERHKTVGQIGCQRRLIRPVAQRLPQWSRRSRRRITSLGNGCFPFDTIRPRHRGYGLSALVAVESRPISSPAEGTGRPGARPARTATRRWLPGPASPRKEEGCPQRQAHDCAPDRGPGHATQQEARLERTRSTAALISGHHLQEQRHRGDSEHAAADSADPRKTSSCT